MKSLVHEKSWTGKPRTETFFARSDIRTAAYCNIHDWIDTVHRFTLFVVWFIWIYYRSVLSFFLFTEKGIDIIKLKSFSSSYQLSIEILCCRNLLQNHHKTVEHVLKTTFSNISRWPDQPLFIQRTFKNSNSHKCRVSDSERCSRHQTTKI